MKLPPALCAFLFAAGLAIAPAVQAQAQWKWKDPSGVVQYSDRPPPQGTADKDILQRPTPSRIAAQQVAAAASAPGAAASKPQPTETTRRTSADAEAARKQAADDERVARQRADNCRAARAQMKAIDSGVRMARFNDKGEREILDDQGRAEEARRARDVISSDCAR